MSRAPPVAASLFDGSFFRDPSTLPRENLCFKHSVNPIKVKSREVKQHTWSILIKIKKGEDIEKKPLTFCLDDPVTISGFSVNCSEALKERISREPMLIDRIAEGEKIEGEEEDVGITVACFLDRTKPSHQAFIDFGKDLITRLQEDIKENPVKDAPKYHEITFASIARQSKKTDKIYIPLRLSTKRTVKDKQTTYPATGFFLNGGLKPMPWSMLYNSSFECNFHFKLSHYSLTSKDASATMYAMSCRRVTNVQRIISFEDKKQMRLAEALGETVQEDAIPIRVPTIAPTGGSDGVEGDRASGAPSIAPDDELHNFDS